MLYQDISISTVRLATAENPRHSEASILPCQNGDLLLAWQRYEASEFGSGDEAPSTVSLLTSKDGGDSWQNERVAADRSDGCVNVYSPNLFRLASGGMGLLYMNYTQLTPGKPQLATICMTTSGDEGQTWSSPVKITENDRFTMSNDCLRRLSSGRLLLPVCHAGGELWSPSEHYTVTALYSDDDGQSWQFSSGRVDLPMRGVMEPFVAENENGTLVMVVRSQLGSLFRAVSEDLGLTWSKPQTTGLSVPESCPFIIRVPESRAMLVVWNNAPYDMHFRSHYGKRSPLTVAITYDDGLTFEEIHNIETDPQTAFSNPGGTWVGDALYLTYWACPYSSSWVMDGLIDLKLARVMLNRGKLKA